MQERLIGLGDRSIKKSYYPELRKQGDELERFRNVLNHASDALFVLGASLFIVDINDTVCGMFGRTRESLVGTDFRELFPAGALDHVWGGDGELLGGSELQTAEVVLPAAGDRQESLILEFSFTVSSLDSQRYIVAVGRDVTEKRTAEDAFRKSEERFKLAMEASNDGLWDWDVTTGEVYYSPAYAMMLGYDPDEVPHHVDSWKELIHPDDAGAAFAANMDCIENRRDSFEVEFRMKAKTGEWRWILGRGKAMARDEYGRATRMVGTQTDITERKAAEERLRASEERYRELSDATFEAIFFSDKGVCIGQNRTAEKMFGYTLEEAIGHMGTEWIHPDYREKVTSNILVGTEVPYEAVALRKDGSTFPCEIQGRMVERDGLPIRITALRDITERKQAEAALKDSEERFRALYEKAPIGIFQSTADGRYLSVNSQQAELLGYASPADLLAEVQSIDSQTYVDPEDRAAMLDLLRDQDEVLNFECRRRKCDGEIIWVTTNIRAVRDGAGNLQYLEGFTTDITERKRAENALRKSEEKFRLLAENAVDVIWTRDANMEPTYFSPAVEKLVGYTPEEMLRLPFREQLTPGSLKLATEVIQKMRGHIGRGEYDKVHGQYELEHLTRNGGTVWAEILFKAVTGADGSFREVVGVSRDITERKQVEEALRESEERYRSILDASPNLVIIHKGGIIKYINETGCTLFGGQRAEQFIGRNAYDFLHPDSLEMVRQRQHRAMEGHTNPAVDVKVIRQDGQIAHQQSVSMPFVDKGEASILLMSVDITERKRAEEALRESEERYRTILEASPNLVVIHQAGIIKYINSAGCALLGGDNPDDFLERSAFDFVPPEYLDIVRDRQKNVAEGKTNPPVDIGAYRLDGSVIYLQSITMPFVHMGTPASLLMAVDITERKRAEEALKESEERYRTILDASPNLIVIHKDGIITYINQSGCDLYGGQHPEEFLGRDVLAFLHPDFRELGLQRLRKTKQGYANPAADIKIIRQDGQTAHVQTISMPFMDKGDASVLLMAVDITERKRAEEALKESEKLFRLVFNQQFQFMAILSPEGRVLEINDLPVRVQLGRREDYMGQLFWKTPAWQQMPEWQEIIRARVSEASRLDGPLIAEDVFQTAAGETRYADAAYTAFRNLDGSLRFTLVQATDITERKRAEEALRKSEARFRNILDEVPQIGLSLLPDGSIGYVNKHFCKLTGWKQEEILGKNWFDTFLPPEIKDEISKVFATTMSRGSTENSLRYVNEIVTKSGTTRIISWSNVLSKDTDGRILDVTCLGVDLTEQVAAREAAEAASRAKSEFLANMSHEIRTPLNGIMGMLQLLQITKLAREQQEYVHAAIQSSKRLNRLLADILDISRVEAGKLQIRSECFDLANSMYQVVELFKPTSQQQGVQLRCHMGSGIPLTVMGDAARMQQVLTNLVGNAFKFTTAGNITIEAHPLPLSEPGKCRVLFIVADTGVGIPDDKLKLLFEPFTQASEGYRREHQGAGLGLSICKRLVELMGGTIAVDTEVGGGTTVYFTITFGLGELLPKYEKPASLPVSPRRTHLKVLLAEDDRVSSLITQRELEKAGHDVTAVADGRQALVALQREDYDVVLMDVQMPVMDGVEATKAIRNGGAGADKAGIPIVAITAYAMVGDKEKFLQAGMDDYVVKPVESQKLREAIQKVVR